MKVTAADSQHCCQLEAELAPGSVLCVCVCALALCLVQQCHRGLARVGKSFDLCDS